jgi:hypothetical protein
MDQKLRDSMTLLGLHEMCEDEITENILKRKYHKMALLYHPDKNPGKKASDKFKEINESYEYAMRYYGYLDEELYDEAETEEKDTEIEIDTSWLSYVHPFLQSGLFLTIQSKLLHSIIGQLYGKCEKKAYMLIEQLDIDKMEKLIALLKLNRQLFGISDRFIEDIELMRNRKRSQSNTIILRPLIKDLFEEQVYKLVENDQTYYVPLWHHELVYDVNGNELCVEIIPIMDENIEIDEKNNVIVYKQFALSDIWAIDEVSVKIGDRNIKIPRCDLKMRPMQQVVMPGHGIPNISTKNIYDVSKKSNMIIVILIT